MGEVVWLVKEDIDDRDLATYRRAKRTYTERHPDGPAWMDLPRRERLKWVMGERE